MALLSRLFSSRRKSQKSSFLLNGKQEGDSWRPYDFNKEQVRVLLFRECDWRGRKLLYDSQSFKNLSNEKSCSKLKCGGRPQSDVKSSNGLSSPSNGCPLHYTKTNADVSMLGEMIFGSVGMTFKGSAFKVHKIKSPTQLMCSKVFLSPKYHRKHLSSDRSLDESCDSSFNSQSEVSVHRSSSDNRLASRTGPLDVPWNLPHGNLYLPVPPFRHASEEDSGFCGDTSLLSAPTTTSSGFGWSSRGRMTLSSMGHSDGAPSLQGSGSFQSMQRRWLRSLHTSMELFCQNPSSCSWCSGPLNSSFSCGNACIDGIEENHQGSTIWASGRRPKIGLAVVVTLIDPLKEQQSDKNGQSSVVEEEKSNREAFFFEHASVVEEMLDRFRSATEKACYARKEIFIPLIIDACTELKQALLDLFTAPRLSRPVWLGLLGQSGAGCQNHSTIALGFLEQLCQSLTNLDTKATNFFISTLITAVLTHHLGWVQTVVPDFSPRKQQGSNGYSLEGLSNSNPYNALWAQLGDLQGTIGSPPRLARTILTGKDTQVLNSLLFVITYFMRCGHVECSHEEGPIEEESSIIVKEIEVNKSGTCLLAADKDGHDIASAVNPVNSIPCLKSSPISRNFAISNDALLQPWTTKDRNESPKGLRRTSSRISGLGDTVSDKIQPPFTLEPDVISDKVQRLCRVPISAISYHLNNSLMESKDGENDSSHEVVFVLGENEKLVGLKGKTPFNSSEEVTAAEEVMEGTGSLKVCEEGGKLALGDQITALAGEFLSRCKEGIRLAGKAADSFGGRTNLNNQRVLYYPDSKNGMLKSVNPVTSGMNCPPCDICGKIHNGKWSGNKKTCMLNRRNSNCYSYSRNGKDRTNVCVNDRAFEEDSDFMSSKCDRSSMKSPEKTWKYECDGVEEVVGRKERSTYGSTLKPEFLVEDVDDISPVMNTAELPCFNRTVMVELPMPKSVARENKDEDCKYGIGRGLASSLLGATTDHYIPYMILQGISTSQPSQNGSGWENRLKRDLMLSIHYPTCANHPQLLDFTSSPYPVVTEPEIAEAVCVLANTDTWEVQLVSSKPCLVDRPGSLGVRVGMSQLVANMLESLLVLWQMRTPPEYCLLHLESKLREIWLRSQSLAQLLLTTEFCNMAKVTASLDLEANDVPLLLAVASTHSPQVTLRYGLSFR